MTGAYVSIIRRTTPLWLVVGIIAGLVIAAALAAVQSARADGHATGNEHIVLSTSEVNFEPGKSRSTEEVWIRGSGFVPGTDITLLTTDGGGALYEISPCELDNDGVCDPGERRDGGGSVWPLIVNDDGGFATSWRLGRFTRVNVGGEAMTTVWAAATDSYEFLASAPLALCNLNRNAALEEGAEPEEVPAFCSS